MSIEPIHLKNKCLEVVFDPQGPGRISLIDRRSKNRWATPECTALLGTYETGYERFDAEAIVPELGVRISLRRTGRETVEATYDLLSKGFQMPLRGGLRFKTVFTLHPDYLEWTLPLNGIVRTDPDHGYRLAWIEPFPRFGAVPAGAEGYLFLPYYTGTLFYFDRKDRPLGAGSQKEFRRPNSEGGVEWFLGRKEEDYREHRTVIYGSQATMFECPNLPYFGAVRGKTGFMMQATSGEFDAELVTRVNAGPARETSSNLRFHLFRHHRERIDPVDRTLRIYPLCGEDASWQGMARKYRDYLVRERGFATLAERSRNNPVLAQMSTSFVQRGLTGFRKPSLDGYGPFNDFMNFDDMAKSLAFLRQAGLKRVRYTFAGFNTDGHDGMYPKIFPVEKRYGGEPGFRRLIKEAHALGIPMNVHVNFQAALRKSPDFNEEELAKKPDGTLVTNGIWASGIDLLVCPTVARPRMKKWSATLKQYGADGPLYCDAIYIARTDCHDPSHPLTRREHCLATKACLAEGRKVFGAVDIEFTIAEMLDAVDGAIFVPYFGYRNDFMPTWDLLHAGLVDEMVPAFNLVCHGLITYCYDYMPPHAWEKKPPAREVAKQLQLYLLRTIEAGALPKDEWRGIPSQTHLKNTAYLEKIICQDFGRLQLEQMADHRIPVPGLVETIYGDGTSLFVNYNEKTIRYKGTAFPSLAYGVR
ncbi:MAG: DUF5696 domain-containing protein [Candidatus Omnitrophota bacterium]